MALYDENGKITIDENAAQYDMNKLREAIVCLQNSRRALNSLIQEATATRGETGAAIIEKAAELRGQVDAMIQRLEETVSFISKTVQHYQYVDRKLKEMISFDIGTAAENLFERSGE